MPYMYTSDKMRLALGRYLIIDGDQGEESSVGGCSILSLCHGHLPVSLLGCKLVDKRNAI